jgi:hypothetical protein
MAASVSVSFSDAESVSRIFPISVAGRVIAVSGQGMEMDICKYETRALIHNQDRLFASAMAIGNDRTYNSEVMSLKQGSRPL